MPLFSIVVPAYNSADYLEKTILSLINQNYENYEVIIVDDGSTDTTKEIAEKYKSRLTFIRQSNQGPASARNLGVKIAKGRYIVSFDSDDILFPDALRIYEKTIDYFKEPPFVFSKMIYFTGNDDILPQRDQFNKIECLKHLNFFKKRNTIGISNSNMIIKRDNLIRAGGYESGSFNFDDRCLAFRLGTESPMIQIISPPTVGHRVYSKSISKNRNMLTNAAFNIIKNERNNSYPGGELYRFDRRGLIGTNLLFLFRDYFGIQNTFKILRVAGRARIMLIQGLVRKFKSRSYKVDFHTINFSG
ncbi:MAG TPA: glycosyltransferase family 2 protein [Ignavibacteriaceae bacterium]|nr:glycosyltransferase family 2 protein [Ignavibacteriaceae bacterium]